MLIYTYDSCSNAKASRVVTGGLVSKQTVMRKIREAVPATEPVLRRTVPVLHVDADEDHVKLQTGDSRIVPLVSVYEGIERKGKRGVCKTIFDSLFQKILQQLDTVPLIF